MTNSEKIKQILLSEIEKMDQHHEDFCRRPGIDFTRDRKIPFGTLLHFQISMESGSVSHELLKYFNFDAQAPSLSAFYQQRAKLSDDVFQKLFYSFNRHFSPRYLLKGRYQLLACDGSGFTFTRNPKDSESYYDPSGRSQKGYNQMYLVPLYDHPESADQYRHICQKVAFDYFPPQGYGEYEISLRVLRFPIGNGTYENIITNLPENEFHADEIKELYRLRWGIETSFCTLKHAIAAVNFHSKSRQMITHEIWARLILFNFCSYITGQVTFVKQKRKHVHQVNFSIAFKTCRHFLRLHSGEAPPDVEGLIRKHTLPVRPSRNFARQQRFQVPVSFTYRF